MSQALQAHMQPLRIQTQKIIELRIYIYMYTYIYKLCPVDFID